MAALDFDLKRHIEKSLEEFFAKRNEAIIDGSCKDLKEYGYRCGYVAALRDFGTLLKEWEQAVNDDMAHPKELQE